MEVPESFECPKCKTRFTPEFIVERDNTRCAACMMAHVEPKAAQSQLVFPREVWIVQGFEGVEESYKEITRWVGGFYSEDAARVEEAKIDKHKSHGCGFCIRFKVDMQDAQSRSQ